MLVYGIRLVGVDVHGDVSRWTGGGHEHGREPSSTSRCPRRPAGSSRTRIGSAPASGRGRYGADHRRNDSWCHLPVANRLAVPAAVLPSDECVVPGRRERCEPVVRHSRVLLGGRRGERRREPCSPVLSTRATDTAWRLLDHHRLLCPSRDGDREHATGFALLSTHRYRTDVDVAPGPLLSTECDVPAPAATPRTSATRREAALLAPALHEKS